ncbi:MAG: RNA polymerase subunit sigma-70, partial [Planctomycetales bacterium]|nr:RNA polymerase subunit sigma-70 [Planctomycetales bacterium]
MHTDYRNPMLKQLRDQQVRFAPRDKKVQQVERAERLIAEIDPARTYSYEYLCFRVTDYRPESTPPVTMSGEQARHDLRLFVEDVSDAANVAVEDVPEPVHTVEELSRLFNVSTKTIARWREQGLVSRRFVFGGRKRVGFLSSSVDRFVSANRGKVQRGERFSQLSENDRDEIIDRARRLAAAGGSPSEIARRIAAHMGRSTETIRYTIKHFDEKHPDLAIFPDQSGPLKEDAKQRIYQQFRLGASVGTLAKRYSRTRNSMYRIINEMRAKRIMELPLDCIHNKEFDRKSRESVIMGEMPAPESATRKPRVPS